MHTYLTRFLFFVFLKQSDEGELDDMFSLGMSLKRRTISFSINVSDHSWFLIINKQTWAPLSILSSTRQCILTSYCPGLVPSERRVKTSSCCRRVGGKGNFQNGQLWKPEAVWPLDASQIRPRLQGTQTHTGTLVCQSTWTLWILYICFTFLWHKFYYRWKTCVRRWEEFNQVGLFAYMHFFFAHCCILCFNKVIN